MEEQEANKKGTAWRRLRKVIVKSPVGRRVRALTARWRVPPQEPAPPPPSAADNQRFADELIESARRESSGGDGPTYAEAVIDFFRGGIKRPMFQSYVNYALRSLARGEKLVGKYAGDASCIASYLDVGCAYGGAPIAMIMHGATRAVGFEYDERLLELASILSREHGVSDRVQFVSGDLTRREDVAPLGQFALTTCIDVLEHVLDPAAAIENLALLAGDSGTVIVDIPNPLAYQTIDSDPHHHLFGSALLSRPDAIRAWEDSFGEGGRYTVGYLHPLEWYMPRFEAAGFEATILDEPPCDDDAVELTLARLRGLRKRLEQRSTDWPPWRRELVTGALDAAKIDVRALRALARTDPRNVQLRHAQPVFHIRLTRAAAV